MARQADGRSLPASWAGHEGETNNPGLQGCSKGFRTTSYFVRKLRLSVEIRPSSRSQGRMRPGPRDPQGGATAQEHQVHLLLPSRPSPIAMATALKGPSAQPKVVRWTALGVSGPRLEAAQGLRVWSRADAVPALQHPARAWHMLKGLPQEPRLRFRTSELSMPGGLSPGRLCPCHCLLHPHPSSSSSSQPALASLSPFAPEVPHARPASSPHAHSVGAQTPRGASWSQRQVGRPVALPSLRGAQEVKLWEGWGAGGVLQEAQVWQQDRTRAGMAGGKGRG